MGDKVLDRFFPLDMLAHLGEERKIINSLDDISLLGAPLSTCFVFIHADTLPLAPPFLALKMERLPAPGRGATNPPW